MAKKITVIENEKYRLMQRNVELESQVAHLRNAFDKVKTGKIHIEDIVFKDNQYEVEWKKRERQLVEKFTTVIRHLQKEISKQNVIQDQESENKKEKTDIVKDEALSGVNMSSTKQISGAHFWEQKHNITPKRDSMVKTNAGALSTMALRTSMNLSIGQDGDTIIEQLSQGILAIPALRQKLLHKLLHDNKN